MRASVLIVYGIVCLCASGCGNQMMRQPTENLLSAPRAQAPADSIPLAASLDPTDAKPNSPADVGFLPNGASETQQITLPEPSLPPPDLSDNARYDPTPAGVNTLKNPLQANSQIIQNGHTLFLNRCVQCHDSSGYGYGPVGAYLVPHPPDLGSNLVQKRSDGAIFWHITMGQGKMPAFKNWTTPYQRWELASYVRSLRASNPSVKTSDTLDSPYPVYGETGFENGGYTTAFKVIPSDPQTQRSSRASHFAQSDNGAWKSAP